MIDIPVEDLVFVVCALIGGGAAADHGRCSTTSSGRSSTSTSAACRLMPLLLSFISMFGVGGLFATQVLDVHGGQAAIVGTAFGLVGLGIAYGLFSLLRRAEADEPFSIERPRR